MKSYTPYSSNRLVELKTVYDLVGHWNFLQEGMTALNDQKRARANYNAESFLTMLTKVTLMPEGIVLLLTSKNGKPLGFGCAFSATDFNGDSCFYVWCVYSNGRCHTCLSELQSHCEDFARRFGHTNIKIATKRNTAAAIRLFEGTLGYAREFLTFCKKL